MIEIEGVFLAFGVPISDSGDESFPLRTESRV